MKKYMFAFLLEFICGGVAYLIYKRIDNLQKRKEVIDECLMTITDPLIRINYIVNQFTDEEKEDFYKRLAEVKKEESNK